MHPAHPATARVRGLTRPGGRHCDIQTAHPSNARPPPPNPICCQASLAQYSAPRYRTPCALHSTTWPMSPIPHGKTPWEEPCIPCSPCTLHSPPLPGLRPPLLLPRRLGPVLHPPAPPMPAQHHQRDIPTFNPFPMLPSPPTPPHPAPLLRRLGPVLPPLRPHLRPAQHNQRIPVLAVVPHQRRHTLAQLPAAAIQLRHLGVGDARRWWCGVQATRYRMHCWVAGDTG